MWRWLLDDALLCLPQYIDMKTFLSLTFPGWEKPKPMVKDCCCMSIVVRLAGTALLCSPWPVTRCLSSWALTAHKILSIIRELSFANKCPGAAETPYQRVYYSKLVLSILQGVLILYLHCQAADTFPITGKALWLISCSGQALNTAFKVIKGSEMGICIMGFIAGAVWWIQWWSKAYYRLSLLLISLPSYATCFFPLLLFTSYKCIKLAKNQTYTIFHFLQSIQFLMVL